MYTSTYLKSSLKTPLTDINYTFITTIIEHVHYTTGSKCITANLNFQVMAGLFHRSVSYPEMLREAINP